MAVSEMNQDGRALGHHLAIGQDEGGELLHGVDSRDRLARHDPRRRVVLGAGLLQLVRLPQQQESRLDRNRAGALATIDYISSEHPPSPVWPRTRGSANDTGPLWQAFGRQKRAISRDGEFFIIGWRSSPFPRSCES